MEQQEEVAAGEEIMAFVFSVEEVCGGFAEVEGEVLGVGAGGFVDELQSDLLLGLA